jgi:hypothetical protein
MRKGLGLLLSAMLLAGTAQQASAIEIVRMPDFGTTNANFSGYAITPIDPDNAVDLGTAAAGNYESGKLIHFATFDQKGGLVGSYLLQFPQWDDVRAIAINSIPGKRFFITVQARSFSGDDRIIEVMVDLNGNIMDTHEIEVPSSFGNYAFPTHAIVIQDEIFISGYICSKGAFPEDPNYSADKTAFVMKFDYNTRVNSIQYFNTLVNTNPVNTPGWNGAFNDYDAALRLKSMNGRLYVMGSANGSANAGSTSINSSKAWISLMDPVTMTVTATSYYGSNVTGATVTPSTLNGSYALDVIPDVQMPGTYYGLTNDLYSNTWRISHLSNTLALGTPTSGFNSIGYNAANASIKATGFWESLTGSNRVGLYGMVGSAVTITPSTAYGTLIASPVLGGVPFAMGIDLGYGNTIGMNYSGFNGHLLGNKPGYANGLNYQEPFWTASEMGEWCNIPFGMRLKPMFGTIDDFSMISHYKNSTGNVNPRYVGCTMDGGIVTCESDQEMVFGIGGINLQSANILNLQIDEFCNIVDAQVQSNPQDPDDRLECSYHNIYRESKPATALQAEEAKGLFPNPASTDVTVMLGKETADGVAVKVTLTDVTGRVVLVHEAQTSADRLRIGLPRLTPGMYQVSVQSNGGIPVMHKLVIQ